MRPTEEWVKKALGRREPEYHFAYRACGRVLVTGGEGSIGRAIATELRSVAEAVRLTDKDLLDVRDERNVMAQFLDFSPEIVVHLAASKHAPLGEEDPYEVVRTNIEGTKNVLDWCRRTGAHCVVASTCKACDPETAYGASKLVAERMALNEGQVVARYYNVVETSGNVFEIWRDSDRGVMHYTDCRRRFISLNEAIALTMWATLWGEPASRYTLTHTEPRHMRDVLLSVYPDRENWAAQMAPRRGDRAIEPRHAACERMEEVAGCEWISRVWNPHDPPNREELE